MPTHSCRKVGGEATQGSQDKVSWVLAVHGGAAQGYFSEKGKKRYQKVMVEACRRAAEVLNAGGTAVEAVKIAVEVLEDDSTTNAGHGSNLTLDGTVEVAAHQSGSWLRASAPQHPSACQPERENSQSVLQGTDSLPFHS